MSSFASVSAVALASILDGHMRRLDSQDRSFGILLGSKSGSTSQKIRVSFALTLPYVITSTNLLQMDFEDLDSDKTITLLARANQLSDQQLVIVGWFATSSQLNSYTPLIHDRFAQKMAQQANSSTPSSFNAFAQAFKSSTAAQTQPIHLTFDPVTFEFKTYMSAPLGLSGKGQNALLLPIPHELEIAQSERPAINLLLQSPENKSLKAVSPLHQFNNLLNQVSKLLDTVLAQVESAQAGQTSLDPKLATLLLNTLNHIALPQTPADKEKWEEEFEAHLADVLMLSYLSNLARYQMELAARLALLPDKNESRDFGGQQAAVAAAAAR